ncbi:TetR family transcriptional regulator [Actinosynnema sp. CS-041913]|uniref:TetR family transcriptional regulator n=1 Tax=Actinosynnema sp. CS-041913 TaxID=3239917 RepID=UPI003D8A050F
MATRRTRRPPEEARRLILDAAAALLAEGGVAAVQVRAVAARVGMTDAGVTHHFQSRDNLLRELLRHGGRQLKAAVQDVLSSWLDRGADLLELVESLANLYRQGYGELAVALHAAGWREHGSGMLTPVVEALHRLRPSAASIEDTQLAVAALHQAMAIDPLYGSAFRRSAGLTGVTASTPTAHLRWWTRQLQLALQLEPSAL